MKKVLLLIVVLGMISGVGFSQSALPTGKVQKVTTKVGAQNAQNINKVIQYANYWEDEIPEMKDSIDANAEDITTNTATIATLNAEIYHAFLYFGDSAVSLSYTTDWARFTNASDSIYIQEELDGFTVTDDTITITNAGDYDFDAKFVHDGDNLETVSIRFYNVTQAVGIPVAGAQTMRGANNFGGTIVSAYQEVDAGDEIVIQYKGDAAGTAVFKNSSVLILRIHE